MKPKPLRTFEQVLEEELKQINKILEKRKALLGPGQSFKVIIGLHQGPIVKIDLPSIEHITDADWDVILHPKDKDKDKDHDWEPRYKKLLEALHDGHGSLDKTGDDWPRDPYVKDERPVFGPRRENYLNDTFKRLNLPYRVRSRNRVLRIVRFLP